MDEIAFSELIMLNASIPKSEDEEEKSKPNEVTGKDLFERFKKD